MNQTTALQLETIVYGADTMGIASAARTAEVQYIGGSALYLAADLPKAGTRAPTAKGAASR